MYNFYFYLNNKMSSSDSDDWNTSDFKPSEGELRDKKLRRREKRRDKKNRKQAINIIVTMIDTMMLRQRKCEDPCIRYSLLANTLMMIFDSLIASAHVFSLDLDDELKSKIQTSTTNIQNDLDSMMKWINTKSSSNPSNLSVSSNEICNEIIRDIHDINDYDE